jgi:single-strand DNA-binding protein
MARSLNKVALIGNLTRDPELRYTPKGTAVCTFGLATNRQWTTDSGEKREEADFHRIVAWNKLAELCAQLLGKGRKVYVEGRLQTRNWQAQDGTQRTTTEIVINDMIILDSRKEAVPGPDFDVPDENLPAVEEVVEKEAASRAKKTKEEKKEKKEPEKKKEEEDIPF